MANPDGNKHKKLPVPASYKHHWPWTAVDSIINHFDPDGKYPKISIITPSYNQGKFLEATIRSVLLQSYPNLEFIIIDGGSTDESVGIIKKYESWLTYWESKKDNGQSDAVNKGLQRATGEIIGWLNSDDYYEPDSLWRIYREFDPVKQQYLLMGDYRRVDEDERSQGVWRTRVPSLFPLLYHYQIHLYRELIVIPCQPSVFFHRNLINEIGLLRTDLNWALDYEYWVRAMLHGLRFKHVPYILSNYRFHSQSKNPDNWANCFNEWRLIANMYFARLSTLRRILAVCYYASILFPSKCALAVLVRLKNVYCWRLCNQALNNLESYCNEDSWFSNNLKDRTLPWSPLGQCMHSRT